MTNPTENTIVVECFIGCGCISEVPRENWVRNLVDSTSPDGDKWMVVIHGMHMHALPFCSLQCLQTWITDNLMEQAISN